jgi:B12-binding domain/radical SAM domain protein
MKDVALLFYYAKENRYSLNVILGALEKEIASGSLPDFKVFFADKKNVFHLAKELTRCFDLVIFLFSFFTTQIFEIFPLVKNLKSSLPKGKVLFLAGGPHPTGDPFGTLMAGFDFVFLFEAEESLTTFLKAYLGSQDFKKIKGIAYLEEGRVVSMGRPDPIDLNKFPPFAERAGKINPIEITRGCPFACSYCQTSALFGIKPRHRSPEVVFHYVEKLLSRGIRDIRFITPNAFSYLSTDGKEVNLPALSSFLKELNKLVKSNGGRIFFGTFPSEVRPEHTTEETVALIKEYCANGSLVIGAQSGSERILKLCRRGHTVSDVERAVKACLKFRITPKVDFIFGLPYEEEEDVKATVEVMKRLAKMGTIIHAHTFMPLPQTAFQNKPAGRLTREVFEAIKELLPKGKLFGAWARQMEFAKKIEEYIKNVSQKRKEGLNLSYGQSLV